MIKNNLSDNNPELAKQWHPTKNGELTPRDVSIGSNKKVWWKCSKGDDHEWEAMVIKRSRGNGCPFCSNHKVAKSNSLAVKNPKLAKEWHPSKNGDLTPFDVTPGSGKKVWWKCLKNDHHVWEAFINNRNKGIGCPICTNHKTIDSNSLGVLNPRLAKEWHPTRNENLTPFDVTPGSNKKVWWKCLKNESHEWETYVSFRTRGRGCPHCKGGSTSSPELRIFCELKSIFPSTQHRKKVKDHEIDIYIPEVKVGIEYDGEYWHRNKVKKDKKKNEDLKGGLHLVRLREAGLLLIGVNDLIIDKRGLTIADLKKLLLTIKKLCKRIDVGTLAKIDQYMALRTWNASSMYKKLLHEKNDVLFEKSISHLLPELAKEWHQSRNQPLLPDNFTPGSNKKVWWKCPKGDGHEWKASISGRSQGGGCPICSNHKIVSSNSLLFLRPNIANEWHPSKNSTTPDKIGAGSNKKVWWKCPKGEDHEWEAPVNTRNNGLGCPICSNQKTSRSNCLAVKNPKLAKEWHPSKNGSSTPYDFNPGSGKLVWWLGKCGHEWKTSIRNRTAGKGCYLCKHIKANKTRHTNKINKNQLELVFVSPKKRKKS